MSGIAFFDFDGTLTRSDTLLAFIRFSWGNARFLAGFLVNSPWLLAYKIGFIPNQAAKERILRHFFGNMPENDFCRLGELFARKRLPGLLRKKAMDEIGRLQKMEYVIVIVSASADSWIQSWSDGLSARLLATRLEVKNGFMTGKILGKNCHGEEKVRRIREIFSPGELADSLAYGDSPADKPMLGLARISFYRPFR